MVHDQHSQSGVAAMIRCAKCSFENPDTNTRCQHCGAALFGDVQSPHAEIIQAVAVGEDEGVATVIPYRNASALIAYYLGLFSCFPALGFPLAIVALVLGIRGLRAVRANPSVHGTAHAWIGLICGGIGFLINLLIITMIVLAIVANATAN
jgi:hypothetical protein